MYDASLDEENYPTWFRGSVVHAIKPLKTHANAQVDTQMGVEHFKLREYGVVIHRYK